MLVFPSTTAREQYEISPLEHNMAHTGYLLAYEQSTKTYWKPIAVGRGAANWKYMGGAMSTRAVGGVDATTADERPIGDITVPAGDSKIVVGSIDLESNVQITLDGEMEFRLLDAPTVADNAIEYAYGSQTLDGEKTLDGEWTFLSTQEDLNLPMTRQTVAFGMKVTVPAGYQMVIRGTPVLNGEYDVDGEIA